MMKYAIISILGLSSTLALADVPQSIPFHALFVDSATDAPLGSVVDVTFSILSPNGNCVLFEEKASNVNLASSLGEYTGLIGSNVRSSKDLGLSLTKVFSNNAAGSVSSSANCSGGYVPAAADARLLRVTVSSGGSDYVLSPDQVLGAVPFAINSQLLNGLDDSAFLKKDGSVAADSLSVSGYFQAQKSGNVLPAVDCQSGLDQGKFFFKSDEDKMYICNGSAWVAAMNGAAGAQGPQGVAGPQGPAGANGAAGAVGPQGPIGLPGVAGAAGAQGPQGVAGPQGPAGANGLDGANGAQGIAGVAGANGLDGANGATWFSGSGAPALILGSNNDHFLDQGSGDVYLKSSNVWSVVSNLKGPTGPQGPAGADGAAGAVGPQGPIGLPGVAGAAGATGATGPQGPIGLPGVAGVQGPQGLQGPQGPAGAVNSMTDGGGIIVSGTAADPVLAVRFGSAASTAIEGNASFGGDVSGNFGALSVDKLKGKAISTSAPALNQSLVWNSSSSQWEPKDFTVIQFAGNAGSATTTNTTATTPTAKFLIFGAATSLLSADNTAQTIVPKSGVLRNLQVVTNTAPSGTGFASSVLNCFMRTATPVAGVYPTPAQLVSTAGNLKISAAPGIAGKVFKDTVNSVTVSAGDAINLKCEFTTGTNGTSNTSPGIGAISVELYPN